MSFVDDFMAVFDQELDPGLVAGAHETSGYWLLRQRAKREGKALTVKLAYQYAIHDLYFAENPFLRIRSGLNRRGLPYLRRKV
jgi:hypothetical protein